jgi:TolB-like protein/Tfp pilus assembly protein PilF
LAGVIAVCFLLAAAVAWLIPKYPQASSRPPQKSIAILPFQNLSNDQESAFFSDGVQEEILSRLSKIASLKVISRTSAERFANTSTDTRKIGQALGVANILHGTVQKAADQVRVTVQLVDAGTARHIWAETYDRKLSDIFQVESNIANNIAKKLEANLTQREAEAVAVQPTADPAAHELYLKGRYFWNKRNPEALKKALDFFSQATQLDPNYAPAYAGIADTYSVMPTYDLCSANECFPLAKAAALKALQLDDGLAEAHAGYGGLLAADYNWTDARAHVERAVELDPNYAWAHAVLGLEVLMNLGEVNAGLIELRHAQELDPLSLVVNTGVGLAHLRLHEYNQARAELRKALELDSSFHFAREVLAQTFDMEGRFDEAIVECRKALETTDAPGVLATLGHAYARAGNRDEALKVLEQLQRQSQKRVVTAINFAWMYIALDQKDEAINWLERAYDDRSLYGIKLDPFLDPLRGEPRFKQLLARVFSGSETTSPAPIAIPEKSIAVLPFENLSEEKQNAYFAEGIQDEVLTNLTKVADLKVISRTSTQQYQSKPGNLAEIARQLGVANILEGSVQKAADQVRVNVQLINAQTGSHLWAETYDRKLTDIFGVESEIAKRIAATLQAKLTGREEQALAVKPTDNPEAYDAYLRGLAFEAHGFASAPSSINLVSKAADFYELSVQLDPKFAIAWARLSRADADLYFNRGFTNFGARAEAAKRALQNAQKLDPESAETLLALGYYEYWVLRDYARAKVTFGRVSTMLPGSSEVPTALGRVVRREGHWDQSIIYYGDALALDPRNTVLLFEAASTDAMVRQFPAALKLYDRALDITPNDPDMMAAKAEVYQAQGTLEEAGRFLSEVNERTTSEDIFSIKINQLRLERNYGEAVRLLQARLAQFHFASQLDKARDQVSLAWMQRLAGDMAGAKVTAEQARNTLEQLARAEPDNYYFPVWLSQAYAALGEKHSAVKAAKRAITLLPRAKDAVEGPDLEENRALIQTIVGDNSRAIASLTQLLQTPYAKWVTGKPPITPALLRLDPIWDPLRADPAFQKLCEEKQL